MKIATHNFNYTPLNRVDTEEGRKYFVNDKCSGLPSVTTILSATKSEKDKKKLEDWRIKVGEEEADRIVNESTNIGSHLHKNLENHILNIDERTGPLISKVLADLIIKKGLCHVSEVWGIEAPLYVTGCYAGTSDLIGIYKNVPCIIDFKNSRQKKKKEYITDYICQLAAYGMAFSHLFNTDIKGGVVMVANRDFTYQEFDIFGADYIKALDDWKIRLDQFYHINGSK